jgi:hypothetical protein
MIERDRTVLMPTGKRPDPIRMAPCAFCGGPPVLDSDYNVKLLGDESQLFCAHVWCHECGARGPNAEGLVLDPPDMWDVLALAVDLWNNRDTRHHDLYVANEALQTFPDPTGRHTPAGAA